MKIRRAIKYWWQRKTRGWDDSEIWSLDHTFIDWFLPRMERLDKIRKEWFVLEDVEVSEWEEMIKLFKVVREDDSKDEELNRALDLFKKYFRRMWW